MDEHWVEVLSSSEEDLAEKNSSVVENLTEENNGSEEENLAENGSVVENWEEENNGSVVENWEEENNGSVVENLTEENNGSVVENLTEENSGSEEENFAEENVSAVENGEEENNSSEEESFAEENGSAVENWEEENNSSEEESFAEENGSAVENWEEENNSSEEENLAEENGSVEEKWTKAYSSAEENSSSEEDWSEEDEENFIEEDGFVFEAATVNAENCVVEIVIVGDDGCGKTQLIEKVFGDHPSLEVENLDGRDEYRIYLTKKMFFHICIYDMKDAEYVRKECFRLKTVLFLCYAVDDLATLVSLEETWIPVSRKGRIVFCFLVGIERGLKPKTKVTNGIHSQEQKIGIEDKARELHHDLRGSRHIFCSTEVKSSMMSLFQSAIDAVYPWTSLK